MTTPRQKRTILSPQVLDGQFGHLQVSVHHCPTSLSDDLLSRVLTPRESIEIAENGLTKDLLAVIIMQQSFHDLVGIGPDVEDEKNRLLESVCYHFDFHNTLYRTSNFCVVL